MTVHGLRHVWHVAPAESVATRFASPDSVSDAGLVAASPAVRGDAELDVERAVPVAQRQSPGLRETRVQISPGNVAGMVAHEAASR